MCDDIRSNSLTCCGVSLEKFVVSRHGNENIRSGVHHNISYCQNDNICVTPCPPGLSQAAQHQPCANLQSAPGYNRSQTVLLQPPAAKYISMSISTQEKMTHRQYRTGYRTCALYCSETPSWAASLGSPNPSVTTLSLQSGGTTCMTWTASPTDDTARQKKVAQYEEYLKKMTAKFSYQSGTHCQSTTAPPSSTRGSHQLQQQACAQSPFALLVLSTIE